MEEGKSAATIAIPSTIIIIIIIIVIKYSNNNNNNTIETITAAITISVLSSKENTQKNKNQTRHLELLD